MTTESLFASDDTSSRSLSPVDMARRLLPRAGGVSLDDTIVELIRQRAEIDQRIADAEAHRDREHDQIRQFRESMTKDDLFKLIDGLLSQIPSSDGVPATAAAAAAGSPADTARVEEPAEFQRNDPHRLFSDGYEMGFDQPVEEENKDLGSKGWRKHGYGSGRTDRAAGTSKSASRAYALHLNEQRKHVPPELRHYLVESGASGGPSPAPEVGSPTGGDRASTSSVGEAAQPRDDGEGPSDAGDGEPAAEAAEDLGVYVREDLVEA